jgi:hypothetical protein
MARKVKNFRDLGGIPTADGKRVCYGKLYRSGHLGKIKPETAEKLRDKKGLRTVIDLRAPAELSHKRDIVPEGVNPVNTWGLVLGDNIGVKFEMNVNSGDVVTFTVDGKAVPAEQNGRIYTIYVAAAQMTDDIVISINGVALEKTYSVRGYADIILNGTYGDKTKNLVKHMLNYGAAAQLFFDHTEGGLANTNVEVTAPVPAGDDKIVTSGSVSGIYFYGASLIHNTRTTVRFYFAGEAAGKTFTIDGVEYQAIAKNSELCYIDVVNIAPQDMDKLITVTVSDGSDALTVSYSPLIYIVRMYNKAQSNETTKALVRALYGYYQAAVEYLA